MLAQALASNFLADALERADAPPRAFHEVVYGTLTQYWQHELWLGPTARIRDHRQHVLGIMDDAGLHVLQPIGLLAHVVDSDAGHRAAAQESNGRPVAWLPVRPEALWLGVDPIICKHVRNRLDARHPSDPAKPLVVMRNFPREWRSVQTIFCHWRESGFQGATRSKRSGSTPGGWPNAATCALKRKFPG